MPELGQQRWQSVLTLLILQQSVSPGGSPWGKSCDGLVSLGIRRAGRLLEGRWQGVCPGAWLGICH